jgi:hypothetical protein
MTNQQTNPCLAKLQCLATKFQGVPVIEADMLYESRLCPGLFRGKSKLL